MKPEKPDNSKSTEKVLVPQGSRTFEKVLVPQGSRTFEKVLVQTFTSSKGWYALEYPRMWEVEYIENIPAFFDPIWGKGAFQVFAVQLGELEKADEKIKQFPWLIARSLKEKMLLFLENQGVSVNQDNLLTEKVGDFSRLAYEYNIENSFYMTVMVEQKSLLILGLYNCEGSPETEEARAVANIVSSLRILT